MKTKLQQELDQDIPKDAVTTRTQAGTSLSYLTGAYVINRLNQVIGQGRWSSMIQSLNKVYEGALPNYKGEEVYNVSYTATVQLNVIMDNGLLATFIEVGYGDGMDKKNPGKAHELAVKEAATDALKRAAKNLGISLGLGLYFKDGDYVLSEATDTVAAKDTTSEITNNSNSSATSNTGSTGSTSAGGVPNGKSISGRKTNGTTGKSSTKSGDTQREQLRLATRIIIAQKKTTAEAILKDFLKGKKAAELSDEDIQDALIGINAKFPELNLLQGDANATTN